MLTMMKEMPQIRKQKISSGSKQENAKAGVSFLSWKVGSENSKENKQDESLLKTTRRWPGEASHQSKDSGYQKKVTYLPTSLTRSRLSTGWYRWTVEKWRNLQRRRDLFLRSDGIRGRWPPIGLGSVAQKLPSVDFWTHKTGQVTAWVFLIIITFFNNHDF